MQLSHEKKNFLFGSIAVLLLLLSLFLFVWYKGFLTSAHIVREDTLHVPHESVKAPDIFKDPRFQQLRIQSQQPLDIGPVGNPNPFKPFEEPLPDIPIPLPKP